MKLTGKVAVVTAAGRGIGRRSDDHDGSHDCAGAGREKSRCPRIPTPVTTRKDQADRTGVLVA